VFVAGGTGFAPIKAMIEQLLNLGTRAEIRLYWGVGRRDDLYELDLLGGWARRSPGFKSTIAVDHGPLPGALPNGVEAVAGNVAQVIASDGLRLAGYDAYIAGPPAMMSSVMDALTRSGVARDRIRVDSFGL